MNILLSRLSRMLLGQLAEQSQYGSNIQIGMMLASFLSSLYLTQQEIAENHEYNLLLDILESNALNEDGFIVFQNELWKWNYGNRDSEYNGCGWMAIYNALLALGLDPGHPADIIKWLEEQPMLNGAILAGQFGSYPWSVGEYFKKHGYNVDSTVLDAFSYVVDYSMIEGYVHMPDKIEAYISSDVHERAENADVSIMFYQRQNGSAYYVTFVGTGERNDDDEIYTFYNDNPPKTPEEERTGVIIATLEEFLAIQKPLWEFVISISNNAG